MDEVILWLILVGLAVNLVVAVVGLFRAAQPSSALEQAVRGELRAGREEARNAGRELREEVSASLSSTNDALSRNLEGLAVGLRAQLETMTGRLTVLTGANAAALENIRATLDARANELRDSNQGALERIRTTFDSRVRELQEGNEKKLDEMRRIVDEKLHDTLEKRLGESFKLVSDRLDAVHKGLGEMQYLATGVGDLKRVLTNVKARGTWAEVQLGAILEQVLIPNQYEKNVRVRAESAETVEYAIRLPGPRSEPEACVWLPIDSKFPQEDYLRVQEAAERGDREAVERALDALARTVRTAAKDVHDKYVSPPHTTDFGIIFLATEGLYAEVLRQPGLVDDLLHRHRVVVAGPTTLAAILSSLRMGFQTLAIEQRAADVWKVLGAVKTEFGKFGEVLAKVTRQLDAATRTIEATGVRTRAMEKRLRSVEQLPEEEATRILQLPSTVLPETDEPALETPADDDDIPF
jgi:DNA recombination protein RmuC